MCDDSLHHSLAACVTKILTRPLKTSFLGKEVLICKNEGKSTSFVDTPKKGLKKYVDNYTRASCARLEGVARLCRSVF